MTFKCTIADPDGIVRMLIGMSVTSPFKSDMLDMPCIHYLKPAANILAQSCSIRTGTF